MMTSADPVRAVEVHGRRCVLLTGRRHPRRLPDFGAKQFRELRLDLRDEFGFRRLQPRRNLLKQACEL